MPSNENNLQAVVEQQAQELRELRLEIESLKQMMFEHRPAFIPAFAATRDRVKRGEALPVRAAGSQHHCG